MILRKYENLFLSLIIAGSSLVSTPSSAQTNSNSVEVNDKFVPVETIHMPIGPTSSGSTGSDLSQLPLSGRKLDPSLLLPELNAPEEPQRPRAEPAMPVADTKKVLPKEEPTPTTTTLTPNVSSETNPVSCQSAYTLAKASCNGSQYSQLVMGPLNQMQMAQAAGDYNGACKAAASIARNSAIMNFATGTTCVYARRRCNNACVVPSIAGSATTNIQKNRDECNSMMDQATASIAQGVQSAQAMSQSNLCAAWTAGNPANPGLPDCTKEEFKNSPMCVNNSFCKLEENQTNPWCTAPTEVCKQAQNASTSYCKCIADAKNCPTIPPPPPIATITPPTYNIDNGTMTPGGRTAGGNLNDDLDGQFVPVSGTGGLGIPTVTNGGDPERLLKDAKTDGNPNRNAVIPSGGGSPTGGGGSSGNMVAASGSGGKNSSSDSGSDVLGGVSSGSMESVLPQSGNGENRNSAMMDASGMSKIDLAALLAMGAVPGGVKRDLASDPALLTKGITGANGVSNFEKVTRKMNEKRPVLLP